MFGKLKEKLKNWTKKISKDVEEKTEVEEETSTPEGGREGTSQVVSPKEEPKEKEIPLPVKFDPGKQKYEPDLEKLKEIAKVPKEKTKPVKAKKIIEKEPKPEGGIQDGRATSKTDEPEPEEPIPDITKDKKSFFKKVTSKITKIKLTEKEFSTYAEDLELLLLENNVALEVAEKIIKELQEKIVGKELLKKEIATEIEDAFKEIINEILIEPFSLVEKIKEKSKGNEGPYVVLFCGINGTGKTTTIAKITEQLKNNKISVVLAAADTFRAASIEQIKKHADNLGVKVISQDYGSDPAAVGFDAIKYAKKNKIDCVLIDTAGRMHTEKNLLKEIEKIVKVTNPDTKIFVGESLTGNDAIEQVKSFDWAINIDGIILTKADIDEKGGTSLSVGYVTKKPILYLGTGQEYDKIEVFNKKKFIERLGL